MLSENPMTVTSQRDVQATANLNFDAGEMRCKFDRQPFTIAHRLATHPLLQLPRLIELSTRLPVESVEYNAGNLPINQDPTLTPRTGLSIEDTLLQLESCQSWMVLKNVEQDAEYKQLLDECLDEVQPVVEQVAPGMAARHAFIFVSSPGAVTPYHVDFEYNFLLQIRGRKSMTIFDAHDRSVLSEIERERAVGGAPRNLQYREEYALKSQSFDLQPGIGVHVPLSSPHWVKVGDTVSVSFSITFHSRLSDRTICAHKTNAQLRKWGFMPRPVGEYQVIDYLKSIAHRAMRKAAVTKQRLLS